MTKKTVKKIKLTDGIRLMTEDEVISKFYNMACGIARKWQRQYEYDDILQIALISLMKAYRGYKLERGAFSTYAYCSMQNAIRKYHRDMHSKKRYVEGMRSIYDKIVDGECKRIIADTISSGGWEDAAIDEAYVRPFIKSLPPGERTEIIEYFYMGYSTNQSAKIHHILPNAVVNRKQRALKRLRKAMI
jgi:RNA polymerase sigma factor (sigma-70 family)